MLWEKQMPANILPHLPCAPRPAPPRGPCNHNQPNRARPIWKQLMTFHTISSSPKWVRLLLSYLPRTCLRYLSEALSLSWWFSLRKSILFRENSAFYPKGCDLVLKLEWNTINQNSLQQINTHSWRGNFISQGPLDSYHLSSPGCFMSVSLHACPSEIHTDTLLDTHLPKRYSCAVEGWTLPSKKWSKSSWIYGLTVLQYCCWD